MMKIWKRWSTHQSSFCEYLIFFLIFCFQSAYSKEFDFQMAITIDDLPSSGIETPGLSRTEISERIIESLKKNKVPGVYGFINGVMMGSSIDYQKILRRWKSSGYFLGNHTFSHISHHEKGTQELIQDIQKNESTLIDFVDTIEELKVFRFPYLEEGNSKQQRYDARFYLNQRKYRTAQVTMDFEDWSWQVPLKRCLDEKNEEKIKELKEAYLKFALDRIETSQSMSQKIWGAKKIKHILLLHFNAPLALWMNDLLKKLSEKGVQFISSKEAIYDSFYDEDTTYMGSVGKTYIMQAFETRNISNHGLTLPVKPTEWLEKQCLQGIRQNN